MEEPRNVEDKGKYYLGFWRFIIWAGAVLMWYVLSVGPVYLACEKLSPGGIRASRFVVALYEPVFWAYGHTPLHKPLGVYLHLWIPGHFGKNGETLLTQRVKAATESDRGTSRPAAATLA
jgi:hypothetical protein